WVRPSVKAAWERSRKSGPWCYEAEAVVDPADRTKFVSSWKVISMKYDWRILVWLAGFILSATAHAGEHLTLANVPAPPPIVPDEPLTLEFSLERAAQSLDTSALHWQKTRKCAACHTLPHYLMARPFLSMVSPEPPE